MQDNSKEFWNNEYWKDVIENNKTDFMQDSWMDKYIEEINKVECKNAIGLINANLSIHYFDMENTIKIFNEINRVLKPNGLFVGRVNSDKNEDYIQEDTQ